jgi:hypothetical protein
VPVPHELVELELLADAVIAPPVAEEPGTRDRDADEEIQEVHVALR